MTDLPESHDGDDETAGMGPAALAEAIDAAATDLIRRCDDLRDEDREFVNDALVGPDGCLRCCGDPVGLYNPCPTVQEIARRAFGLAGQLHHLTTTDPDEATPIDAAAQAAAIGTEAGELVRYCDEVVYAVIDGEALDDEDEELLGHRDEHLIDSERELADGPDAEEFLDARSEAEWLLDEPAELVSGLGACCQWCCDRPEWAYETPPAVRDIGQRTSRLSLQLRLLAGTGRLLAHRYARAN